VYRRGRPAFIIVNIHNLTAISLVIVISDIKTGLSPLELTGLLYSTLAGRLSRWVQWVISLVTAVFFLPLTVNGFPLPPLHPLPVGGVVVFDALDWIGSVGLLVTVALTNRHFVD
tara:strand:- start:1386 stop:1730 length:345 start_codon:yes stop_codon:yes gene_type:complete